MLVREHSIRVALSSTKWRSGDLQIATLAATASCWGRICGCQTNIGHGFVIVGAGFGGLAAAKSLSRAKVDVTIVDKRNYHLFQPLLYQVATADLSPADVAWPIRSVFTKKPNVSVVLGKVEDVDLADRVVITEQVRIPYDYLIIANGSHHSYFGNEHWEPYAPGLKRIIDATEVRKRVLVAFELAEIETDATEQDRLMTFVVVGGGPTGVEMAGAIAELSRWTLSRDFRSINSRDARICF